MLIPGTVLIVAMGGALTLFATAAIMLAVFDRHYDPERRHWRPAENAL